VPTRATVPPVTRTRHRFQLLLSAALIAHVLMLAGHEHGDHAPAAAVVTHAEAATTTHDAPAPLHPGHAAALGAACLVALAGVVIGARLLVPPRRARPGSVRWRPRPSAAPLATSPPLRPPRTPVAERVVLSR
jgi:hypothetical protein